MSTAGCLSGAAVGPSPADFVTPLNYFEWVWEIDSNTNPPSNAVLSFAENRLLALVDKPEGVTITYADGLPTQSTWTRQDLDRLHAKHVDEPVQRRSIVTHILWLGGTYEDPDVLGVALGHRYIAIFAERIHSGCQQQVGCTNSDRVTEIVLTHELGHIIGLVNNGLPMVVNHEHPNEAGHSDNQNSIMWPAVDSRTVFDLLGPLGGGLPDDFDANDRRDVCAAGGKCA